MGETGMGPGRPTHTETTLGGTSHVAGRGKSRSLLRLDFGDLQFRRLVSRSKFSFRDWFFFRVFGLVIFYVMETCFELFKLDFCGDVICFRGFLDHLFPEILGNL
jgi:hypothetical protein